MYTVRRLNPEDAGQLWRLRLEALETDPQAFRETAAEHRRRTVESYAEQLTSNDNRSFVMGAFDPTLNLVGMAGFYSKQPDAGCIWGMYLTPSHRGTGLGAKLVNAIVDQARRSPEIEAIHLTVAHSQPAARRLYERCGFTISPEKPTTICGGNLPEDQDNMVLRILNP